MGTSGVCSWCFICVHGCHTAARLRDTLSGLGLLEARPIPFVAGPDYLVAMNTRPPVAMGGPTKAQERAADE